MLKRILEIVPKKHGAKKELADAVGFPPNLLTEWKAGRNKSYPKYAPQIAEFYGVSLDWLSGATDEKKPALETENGQVLDIEEMELRRKIRLLPKEAQQMILAQIDTYLSKQ